MRIYVYADESGVFDPRDGKPFVYGGVIVPADRRQEANRRYIGMESSIRRQFPELAESELKASALDMRTRSRVFRSISGFGCFQFAAIVNQARVYPDIYSNKQDKQRFLDYALKRAIKTGVLSFAHRGLMTLDSIDGMSVVVDEHSTSTSGRYNLEQSINQEFRFGNYDQTWTNKRPPVFGPDFPAIPIAYVDSAHVALVRAADVTANWVYRAERDSLEHPEVMDAIRQRVALLRLP